MSTAKVNSHPCKIVRWINSNFNLSNLEKYYLYQDLNLIIYLNIPISSEMDWNSLLLLSITSILNYFLTRPITFKCGSGLGPWLSHKCIVLFYFNPFYTILLPFHQSIHSLRHLGIRWWRWIKILLRQPTSKQIRFHSKTKHWHK